MNHPVRSLQFCRLTLCCHAEPYRLTRGISVRLAHHLTTSPPCGVSATPRPPLPIIRRICLGVVLCMCVTGRQTYAFNPVTSQFSAVNSDPVLPALDCTRPMCTGLSRPQVNACRDEGDCSAGGHDHQTQTRQRYRQIDMDQRPSGKGRRCLNETPQSVCCMHISTVSPFSQHFHRRPPDIKPTVTTPVSQPSGPASGPTVTSRDP